MTTKKKNNVDCLYDIVRKEYVPGSKVLAKETRDTIRQYAKDNSIVRNHLRGKETIDVALEKNTRCTSIYKTDFQKLIGSSIDQIYSRIGEENLNVIVGSICAGIGAVIADVSLSNTAGPVASSIPAGFGALTGGLCGRIVALGVQYLSERQPLKRINLLKEVLDVYKNKNLGG